MKIILPGARVGVNMVKSIRHWVSVFGLLDKDKSEFIKTNLNYDPFLDKTTTSWILHYNMKSLQSFAYMVLVFYSVRLWFR